jgi:hypothetical protein
LRVKECLIFDLKKKTKFWIGLVFFLFGILTIVSGGRSLFTEDGIESRGAIVPVVLWFNFFAGFFYIAAGFLVSNSSHLVRWLSVGISIGSTIVLIYLLGHIVRDEAFQIKTLFAMSFRVIFWISFSVYFQNLKTKSV